MSKQNRIGVGLLTAVFACIALASLLLAQGGVGGFQITSHDPLAHEVGVALTATVQATFSDHVDSKTVSNDTFVLHGHLGGLAIGDFKYDDGTLTLWLYPKRQFHTGEVLRVSASSGILNEGSEPLTPYGWQFTAGNVYPRCVGGFADIGAGLTGVRYSSVAWGDYDNDGDLDILLTGYDSSYDAVSKVYRSDGGGTFTDIGAGLTGVYRGSVAWGDYNNDGDLDILLTGRDSADNPVATVYRNDGGGLFTAIGAALTGVYGSSVAWGDYDNDGDLDILLTGYYELPPYYGPVSVLYRNDGGAIFTAIDPMLTSVWLGSVAWGDYDNDGDLDILLTGCGDYPSYDSVSKVYRNDGPSGFTDIGAGLTAVSESSAAWGDVDNDGDLDILLTGWAGSSPVSKVYRNDGGGAFTDISAGLTDVYDGSVAWGDYDNDGDLDILLTGVDSSSIRVSRVYRNEGGGAFTDTGDVLWDVTESSVAWGDYDNDGDLDILLTGRAGGGNEVSMLYRNDDCLPALEISKMVGDGNPLPGQGLEYTIVVSNSGVADATGAVISDTLPAEMVFAGPVTLDPPGAGIVGTPPTVLHDATIGAGGKISVTFAVTVSMRVAPGAVTNTAAVHCSEVPAPVEASVPITVANARPALGTVDPSSGSGMTGVMTYFSTTWTDNNGWQDLKQCYFHIGDSPSLVGNVTLMYNAAKDKLWMRSDDGTVWFGGHAPGTPFIMQNGRAIVHCSLTTAQGAGDTLTMTWAIQFKPGFEGTKKLGLKCKDRSKAKAKGKWKGTWTITPWRM